jgi:hypothetical protein
MIGRVGRFEQGLAALHDRAVGAHYVARVHEHVAAVELRCERLLGAQLGRVLSWWSA